MRNGISPTAQLTTLLHSGVSALAFLCLLLAALTAVTDAQLPGKPGWPDAVLVLTTMIATLLSLARQLPGQNVLLAAAGIGLIGGAVHTLGAVAAVPFGPFTYTSFCGPLVFGVLGWPMPLIWVIVILNSRGVARLILRPWRTFRSYGFWLIGITVALTVLFDLALEPFATRVKHFWIWQPTKFPFTWHGVPLVNSLAWALTALLILALTTPALINKQQRPKQPPPDYHPLVIWLLAVALFVVGAAAHQLWPAAVFGAVSSGVVTFFAIRGAKW